MKAPVSQFVWPVRVYYEDTDGGGVVYHANYLKFMERARTEWLRGFGFEQTELRTAMGVIFVVRGLKIQYRRPACFNDLLTVITKLIRVGRSLLEFEQTIKRGDVILTESIIEVVCVDADQFKPASIPTEIRNMMQLTEYE